MPPLQEQKEVLGDSMKELLDGRLLADTVLRKNIGFILFLTFLGIVYIANGYATGEVVHEEGEHGEGVERVAFRIDDDSLGVDADHAFPRRWRNEFRRRGWILCKVRNHQPKSIGNFGW